MKYTCNRERMTRLVEELESGNRPQTVGLLRDFSGFCCLGVASDLSDVGGWEINQGVYFFTDNTGHDSDCSALTQAVMEYYELDPAESHLTNQLPLGMTEIGDFLSGSDSNDNGKTFAEIAAMIRKAYLEDDE